MSDHLLFADRVSASQAEIESALRFLVRMWTFEEIENGNFDEFSHKRFLRQYAEWDHEKVYPIITEEMERVKNELLGSSEAV